MTTPIAAYFDALRRRFPAQAALPITNSQQSLEMMEFMATAARPQQSRCAHFEIGSIRFLVWEMDKESDSFQIFVTTYCISLGILKLSTKPSGTIIVAGFSVDLTKLAEKITSLFLAMPAESTNAQPKRKALLFGFCESFGHHFWNEIGGLVIARQTGLFDRIDGIVVGPFDYFNLGPIMKSAGKTVWKVNTLGPVFVPEQLLICSSNVVTEEARRLVLDNAAAQAPLPEAKPERRMICFQIRRHRRPWINEEDGLYKIISACAAAWPNTIFIIDGHSTSKGVLPVKPVEIAQESAFALRLAEKLGAGIDVRLTIGMDVNKKINILKSADLFVGPVGSGGVLSSWLLRKPTIAYGPKSFCNMARFQDSIVPEGGSTTETLADKFITDHEDSAQSFDVDVEAVVNLIENALEGSSGGEMPLAQTA